MANSSEEIREIGLTTPDKPVAKRSSTVPVQGRVAKKRTNEHGACLASHRSTLLRMLLFVLLTPIISRCPFLSYPPLCLYSAPFARPRAPVRVMVQNPRSFLIVKKKKEDTDRYVSEIIIITVNIIFINHLNHIFSFHNIIFKKLDGI